jgi:prepilin-type N-terminal cleavage/methylation domain-containing protein
MNKTLRKNSSFTLIELLVVIVIIGILAGLVTIAATSFINNSHNARMVAELAGISKKLIGETEFPAGNFCMEDSDNAGVQTLLTFLEMEKLPSHPLYKYTGTDGKAHENTNECFLYFSDGEHYSIRVPTVGNKGYLIQESRNPNPQGIQEKCDEGWIPFGNRCIMQYEAKKGTGNIATSVATGTPWVSIYQDVAKAECEKINAHLITNAEWMAIARDIEAQGANWTDGTVGSGVLKRGNIGIATDTGCYDGPNPDYKGAGSGTNRDSDSPARLVLSNGQSIWDFSGNVWEWVDHTIAKDDVSSTAGWTEFSSATFNDTHLPKSQVIPLEAIPSTLGGGKIYYGSADPRAFLRGGDWNDGAGAGVFALNLDHSPSISDTGIGFRCAR